MLHGRREVEGSLEILDGVYAGGVESASELVRGGEAQPGDFRLLAGYSGWGAGQLQQELREGTWWVVAASPDLTLDLLAGERPRGEGALAGTPATRWTSSSLLHPAVPCAPAAAGGSSALLCTAIRRARARRRRPEPRTPWPPPAETGMWDPSNTGGDWGGPADVKLRCWERILNQAGVNFKALGL